MQRWLCMIRWLLLGFLVSCAHTLNRAEPEVAPARPVSTQHEVSNNSPPMVAPAALVATIVDTKSDVAQAPTGPMSTAPEFPLEHIDSTITPEMLVGIRAANKAVRISGKSLYLALAIHVVDTPLQGELNLLFLRSVSGGGPTDDPDYHYTVLRVGDAKMLTVANTPDGHTFPPRHYAWGDVTEATEAPNPKVPTILFAIRPLPKSKPANTQLVVYRIGSSIRIARRESETATWQPVARAELSDGAEVIAVGTSYPH